MQAEFFQDIESDCLYGCLGPMASHGLFRLRASDGRSASWEHLAPDSPEWDSVHQRIYRNHRVTKVEMDRLPAGTPSLPQVPPEPVVDEQKAPDPIPTSAFPKLHEALTERPDSTLRVHVLLHEDGYESAFGDGEFHYLRGVFPDEEEATAEMERDRGEWDRFHLRTMSIRLDADADAFAFPDFHLERYDRYTPKEVLEALEATISRP